MQRKGNAIRSESQVKNQISVGIDMGGSLWATAVQDWEAGKMRTGFEIASERQTRRCFL